MTGIRPLSKADVPALMDAWRDPTLRYWLNDTPAPTKREAKKFVKDGNNIAIVDGYNSLIGAISISGHDHPNASRAELTFWLAEGSRGAGHMRAALDKALYLIFWVMKYNRVTVLCVPGHHTEKIVRSLGFDYVGTEHECEELGDGSVTDLDLYELLCWKWKRRDHGTL